MSFSKLLSFSPSVVGESAYYDEYILKAANRAKLKVEDTKVPKGLGSIRTLILAYNPESLSVNRSVNWESAPTQGNTSQQSFSGGGEDTMSVPILLDGSEWEQEGGGSILTYIKYLHYLAAPYDVEGQKKPNDIRPCMVSLTWGKLVFLGVITGVKTNIEMFNETGDPMRAVVTVDLKGVFCPESISAGKTLILAAKEKADAGGGGSAEDDGEGT